MTNNDATTTTTMIYLEMESCILFWMGSCCDDYLCRLPIVNTLVHVDELTWNALSLSFFQIHSHSPLIYSTRLLLLLLLLPPHLTPSSPPPNPFQKPFSPPHQPPRSQFHLSQPLQRSPRFVKPFQVVLGGEYRIAR